MGLLRKYTSDVASIRELKHRITNQYDKLSELRHSPAQANPKDACWLAGVELAWLENYTQLLREIIGMATKKKYDGVWKGFVDVNLTSSEKELFAGWEVHDDDLWILFQQSVIDGHKFTLNWNKQNETFVASFTGGEVAGENAGYTLSAFARTWYDALRVLCFKHEIVLERNWSAAKSRVTDNIG